MYNFFLLYLQFWAFFSWIRIFRIRFGFFGRSGSGLRKKVWSGSGQKDPDPKHCFLYCEEKCTLDLPNVIIIRGRIGRRRRWTLSWAWLGGRRSWGWTWPGGGMMARAPSTSQPFTRYYRQLSGDLCVTFSDVEPFHFHPAPASQDPSSGYVVHNFLLLGLFYSQLGTSSFLCSSSTSLTGID